MTRRPGDDDLRIMPWWLVLGGLAVAVVAGSCVLAWLLHEADAADTAAALRIEAIRTSLAVVAGTGGAIALLYAARQQWIKERAQRHGEAVAAREQAYRERIQAHRETVAAADEEHRRHQRLLAERDATERRITHLYSDAANLLASEKPAIRTAGLYALERLAQDYETHRQTIVEVICAYLRLESGLADDPDPQHVRATALRILARHLRPLEPHFWPGMALDLSGTLLMNADLSGCEVATLDLSGAELRGNSTFSSMTVNGELRATDAAFGTATFDQLHVHGRTLLDGATFRAPTSFTQAVFERRASFRRVAFLSETAFNGTTFARAAIFDQSTFQADALFMRTRFQRRLAIESAVVTGAIDFTLAQFAGPVTLRRSQLGSSALFEDARFHDVLNLARTRFGGAALFAGASLRRHPVVDQTLASADAFHHWPTGCTTEPAGDGWILLRTPRDTTLTTS